MERRHFLKLAFGFAAGAAALAAGAEAEAAPLAPQPLTKDLPPGNNDAQPAVTTGDEVDRLSPERGALGPRSRPGMGQAGWGWAPPLGLAPPSLLGLPPPLLAPPPSLLAPPLLVSAIDPFPGGRNSVLPLPCCDSRSLCRTAPKKKPRASGVFAVMRDVKLSNGSVRHPDHAAGADAGARHHHDGSAGTRRPHHTASRPPRPAGVAPRPRRDWARIRHRGRDDSRGRSPARHRR